MSEKIRNIIAITIGAIAVAAVIVVIVLACITVKPMEYYDWLNGYEDAEIGIYYNGRLLNQATNAEGKLVGEGHAEDYEPEYSYADIIESMNFSLFSACIQFNYDYRLRLADEDVDASERTVQQIRDQADSMTENANSQYTVKIKFAEPRTLTLKDKKGNEATQTYDSAIFTLTEDSDWARLIDAYVFIDDDLRRDNPDELENTTYYALKFGAKTSTTVEMLDAVFGNVQE